MIKHSWMICKLQFLCLSLLRLRKVILELLNITITHKLWYLDKNLISKKLLNQLILFGKTDNYLSSPEPSEKSLFWFSLVFFLLDLVSPFIA